MRTLIDIRESQLQALDDMARARQKSRAALIREAIDDFLNRNPATDVHAARTAAFGLWASNGEDGLSYQDRMRAEW